MAITGRECCIQNVSFSYSKLMIVRSKVYFRKATRNLELITKDHHSQKMILIFYGEIVQFEVVITHLFSSQERSNCPKVRHNVG